MRLHYNRNIKSTDALISRLFARIINLEIALTYSPTPADPTIFLSDIAEPHAHTQRKACRGIHQLMYSRCEIHRRGCTAHAAQYRRDIEDSSGANMVYGRTDVMAVVDPRRSAVSWTH